MTYLAPSLTRGLEQVNWIVARVFGLNLFCARANLISFLMRSPPLSTPQDAQANLAKDDSPETIIVPAGTKITVDMGQEL